MDALIHGAIMAATAQKNRRFKQLAAMQTQA